MIKARSVYSVLQNVADACEHLVHSVNDSYGLFSCREMVDCAIVDSGLEISHHQTILEVFSSDVVGRH